MNGDSTIERPLPHSVEAERAILGAILVGGSGAGEAITRIQVTDFFLPVHQKIFRQMKLLHDQGIPTDDFVLLYESLRATDEIEEAGGAPYLSSLLDGVPRVANIVHYIEIMESKSQLRRCGYIAETILQVVLGANCDVAEALPRISNLFAQLREEVEQNRILNFRTGAEIAMADEAGIEWIVPGYVAKGAITELGGKVKTGKTTLIMNLVRQVVDGGSFLEKSTLKTPVVYLTEQPITSFRHAMERSGLLGREDVHVLLHGDTRALSWPQVASASKRECQRCGSNLLVVDTLPQFAGLKGDSENNAGDALTAMQPLQEAAADGIAIILSRHERKSGGEVGDSGRGSSAFAGAVDTVLSLRKPGGNSKRTHRVLQALSRFSDTPSELLIELQGGGYVSLGDPEEAALRAAKECILAEAPKSESDAADLKELAESAKASRATTQRAVEDLCGEGLLGKIGKGKRGSPFRYFKPGNRICPTSNVSGQKESNQKACGTAVE